MRMFQLDRNGTTIGMSQGLCTHIAYVKNDVCLLCTVLRGSTTHNSRIRPLKDRTCEAVGTI